MPKASGEKLVIGTLANWVGLPAWYAYAEGYYEEVGLDVEIVNFGSQGTLVNEAMAADECDIAVSGMASVYALSTGMYKYIGDGCLTISGETLYGRPDDAIYKAGADANGVYGSADALKDAVILGPMNTTAQMNAIAYMQYFGIDANSFTFTNLDYSSALAALVMYRFLILHRSRPRILLTRSIARMRWPRSARRMWNFSCTATIKRVRIC